RWQHGMTIAALCLADSTQIAWAEWYRHPAEIELPPLAGLPRELWRFEIDLPRVADLLAPGALESLGLPAPVPDRRQWRSHQPAGEALYAADLPALIAPSAARPSGAVLCMFRPRRELPGVRPAGQPDVVSEPPPPPRGMRT
ncbi:MAG: RES domain-containing protein, partial [Solirubrobacteraceae bacterium]